MLRSIKNGIRLAARTFLVLAFLSTQAGAEYIGNGSGTSSQPAWVVQGAVWAADLYNNAYFQGILRTQSYMISDTRASTAYLGDSSGQVYTSFANDTLARVTGVGGDFEGTFTNKIRNPRGEGGVVGTIGVTNKSTGYNAAPPTLVPMGTAAAFNSAVSGTGISASGGDANTLFGVVDDIAALQAAAASDPFIQAGLTNGWLNGRVYKVDNSAGATYLRLIHSGSVGATGDAVFATYVRGSGTYTFHSGYSAGSSSAMTAGYNRKTWVDTVGTGGASRVFWEQIDAGAVAYIILFDLISASTAAPVPTVVAGASATGALPTNAANTASAGLNIAYLGANSSGDIPKYRVRYVGTTTSASALKMRFEDTANATASAGQAWGTYAWLEKVSGTVPSMYVAATSFATGTSLAEFATGASAAPTTTRALYSAKGVIASATADNVRASLNSAVLANATAYDFTIDVYAPQLLNVAVSGSAAGYLPTYPILPPAGTPGDSTRVADAATAANFTWFTGANLGTTGGSILLTPNISHVGDGVSRPLLEFDDGTSNNRVTVYLTATDKPKVDIISGGVSQASVNLTTSVTTGTDKLAVGWSASGGYITNGTETVTFGAITLPTGLNAMLLGDTVSTSNAMNDIYRQVQITKPLTQARAKAWAGS
jgi:hypothetical protein